MQEELERDSHASATRAPPKGPSFRKNVFFSVVGNLVLAGTQWLVLIVLSKLGEPADIGVWTLATALVTPTFMLCDMAMMDAHTIDDLTKYKREDNVALRVIGAMAAAALCLIIGYLWFGDQPGVVVVVFAFVVLKFIHSQMMLNVGFFQREQRVDLMARSSVTRCFLGVLVFGIVFYATNELWMALIGQAFAWMIVLAFVDRHSLIQVGIRVPLRSVLRADLRKLFRLFRWLPPMALSSLIATATPGDTSSRAGFACKPRQLGGLWCDCVFPHRVHRAH